MSDIGWQTEQFELHRTHLETVAYRMLGSASEAEDAVQEAWLRLSRSREDEIHNMRGWLTTVVGRMCIDMLRARGARREDYVGDWLSEPAVWIDDEGDPEQQVLMADTVGVALLVVLETLTPGERLAYVLHDMFALPFDEIAQLIERTPQAARQLASRARRRVRSSAPRSDADPSAQRELVDAFLKASRAGDFDTLLAMLDKDVVFRRRGIGLGPVPVITGAEVVARRAATQGPRVATLCRPAIVAGSPGIVIRSPRGLVGVIGFTVRGGKIATIDLLVNADEFRRLHDELRH